MNHALLLTKNCLEFTKRCVESLRTQDIPVKIHLYDNLSTDGTPEWIDQQVDIVDHSSGVDLGVSAGWNFVLDSLFSTSDSLHGWHADHVLVLNNDTITSPSLYRKLLSCDVPFVTGAETTNMDDLTQDSSPQDFGGGPQFSCFLIRKDAWETIGPFDESMRLYASDCDYHARAHRRGVRLLCSPTRYYHERSSTINTAEPEQRRLIHLQADADRDAFYRKWGVGVGGSGYEGLFDESLFGVDRDTIIP